MRRNRTGCEQDERVGGMNNRHARFLYYPRARDAAVCPGDRFLGKRRVSRPFEAHVLAAFRMRRSLQKAHEERSISSILRREPMSQRDKAYDSPSIHAGNVGLP